VDIYLPSSYTPDVVALKWEQKLVSGLYIQRGEKGSRQPFTVVAYTVFDPETFQMLFRGVTGVHMVLVEKVTPRGPQTIRLNWVG
jgi:hypothetical protein